MNGLIYIIGTSVKGPHESPWQPPRVDATAWTMEEAREKAVGLMRSWLWLHVWRFEIPTQMFRGQVITDTLDTLDRAFENWQHG